MYPITFFVSKGLQKSLVEFGVGAKISPSVFFEQMFSLYTNELQQENEIDFVNAMNNLYAEWNSEMKESIPVWQRILGTKNSTETLRKIDGILKGRIKYDEKTKKFESNDYE